MNQIRKQIKSLIKAHGLNATAREAGISAGQLSVWLRTGADLSLEKIRAVANVLGYDLVIDLRRRD